MEEQWVEYIKRQKIVIGLICTFLIIMSIFRPNIVVALIWPLFITIIIIVVVSVFKEELRGILTRLGGLKLGGLELTLKEVQKFKPEFLDAIERSIGNLLDKWLFSYIYYTIDIKNKEGDADLTIKNSVTSAAKGIEIFDMTIYASGLIENLRSSELKPSDPNIRLLEEHVSYGGKEANLIMRFGGITPGKEIKFTIKADLKQTFPAQMENWYHYMYQPHDKLYIKIFLPHEIEIKKVWYTVENIVTERVEGEYELPLFTDKHKGNQQYLLFSEEKPLLLRKYTLWWEKKS